MKDYGSIINRVKKAINTAESKVNGSTVHVKTIDDDISQSNGLIVILHPNYLKSKHKVRQYAEL